MQIFFACMCATLTLSLSRSAGKAIFHSGSFGWFNQVGEAAARVCPGRCNVQLSYRLLLQQLAPLQLAPLLLR